jgi:hypothetical protein
MDTYKTAASTGFDVLVNQYKTPNIFDGNFWFAGNTLRTCLSYLIVTQQTDTQGILTAAYQIYLDLFRNPGWWRDDYGWWGNAFIIAINNRQRLGYQGSSYDGLFQNLLDAAQFCWEQLANNWSEKLYNSQGIDNAADSADIEGGVFNTDSNASVMSGRNSVTNEGFWILSQGLAQLTGDPKYAEKASAESNWFQQWLALPNKQPGKIGILNQQGLVLERPMGNKTDNAFYWSGDQGLFIRAIRAQPIAGSNAIEIANSVVTNMTDEDKILHEYIGFLQYPELDQFIADYATGKGIFMRNLSELNQEFGQFTDFIKRNATAVWCNKLPGNQFTFNWNPPVPNQEPTILRVDGKSNELCDLIMQTAGQDALNAAVLIAPDEAITCPPPR